MIKNDKASDGKPVDVTDMIALLRSHLPPVIARKKVEYFLGGIVSSSHLASADSAGTGPDISYDVGDCVAYETESLLEYVSRKWPVQFRDKNIMNQLMKKKRKPNRSAPRNGQRPGGGSASNGRNAQSA